MKRIALITMTAIAFCGCKSIRVERIERTPVQNGTNGVIVVESVTHGEYYAYGIENNLEGLSIEYAPTTGVKVAISKVAYDMSSKHAEIVDKSLTGAATLAAKIGAAIATAGGSAGAEAVASMVQKFVAKGGDVTKAAVSCADGSCTITDGSVCVGGACSE